jgi:hypothetical protein
VVEDKKREGVGELQGDGGGQRGLEADARQKFQLFGCICHVICGAGMAPFFFFFLFLFLVT